MFRGKRTEAWSGDPPQTQLDLTKKSVNRFKDYREGL